jgi:4'-phosphopantetheinyl transferase
MSFGDTLWAAYPHHLEIVAREIHVWRVRLDCSQSILECLESSLAPNERDRADRFFFLRDRNAFVATRGILRRLLAKYLQRRPADIEFVNHVHGKPFLASRTRDKPLEFNVSHSHGLALLAFSVGRRVGVDVELVRQDIASEEIAERFFAAREIAELNLLPPTLRAEGFFLCWTRKEAYVKALGNGLQMPLTSFCVSLTPSQPESLESTDSSRWTLQSLCPAPGYVGALVGEGKDWQVRLWDWQMDARMRN